MAVCYVYWLSRFYSRWHRNTRHSILRPRHSTMPTRTGFLTSCPVSLLYSALYSLHSSAVCVYVISIENWGEFGHNLSGTKAIISSPTDVSVTCFLMTFLNCHLLLSGHYWLESSLCLLCFTPKLNEHLHSYRSIKCTLVLIIHSVVPLNNMNTYIAI